MTVSEYLPDGTVVRVDEPASADVQVSFFVPCYNEERNICGVLEKLAAVTGRLGLSHEVLVFDDGSVDRTIDTVRRWRDEHPGAPVRILANSVNRGLARNFIEGAFQARGTYYRVVCGDDVEPEDTLEKILSHLGKADIVIPYHTEVIGRPWHRKAISRLYTTLVNIASGRRLHYYNGLPLYRRHDVLRYHVEATGLGYQAEFLLRLLQEGRTFIEVPLVAADREGSGSLNVRNFVSVGYSIFKITMSRLRRAVFG